MDHSRRIAAALTALAVVGLASAAVAAPGVSGAKKPARPAAGNYVMHSPGNWSKASFKLQKKGGTLTLTKMTWSVKAAASSGTTGICPMGKYSLVGTEPVRLVTANDSHHEKVWVVGRHSHGGTGVTFDKVKIQSPDGVKKSHLVIDFKPNVKAQNREYSFSNDGTVSNADGPCSFNFTQHHG
jgi:hypothetical protein